MRYLNQKLLQNKIKKHQKPWFEVHKIIFEYFHKKKKKKTKRETITIYALLSKHSLWTTCYVNIHSPFYRGN